jgi:hypothetical protein
MFDHVYSEETPHLQNQRRQLADMLEQEQTEADHD